MLGQCSFGTVDERTFTFIHTANDFRYDVVCDSKIAESSVLQNFTEKALKTSKYAVLRAFCNANSF
ncbi:MAG: hypothetical protein EAZ92_03830 [Candidatus Kapaibacterium sp.]|nr:MAG: hypothetical protein EAZ92_03830 [Candidatus Kapabacteria bacterium]